MRSIRSGANGRHSARSGMYSANGTGLALSYQSINPAGERQSNEELKYMSSRTVMVPTNNGASNCSDSVFKTAAEAPERSGSTSALFSGHTTTSGSAPRNFSVALACAANTDPGGRSVNRLASTPPCTANTRMSPAVWVGQSGTAAAPTARKASHHQGFSLNRPSRRAFGVGSVASNWNARVASATMSQLNPVAPSHDSSAANRPSVWDMAIRPQEKPP